MEKARNELEVKQANKYSFQEMINKLNKMQSSHVKPSCPTCNRHFDSNSEVNDLKRNLENDIKKIPSKALSIQNKLQKATQRYDKLQVLLPEKKQTDEMKMDVQQLIRTTKQMENNLKRIEEQVYYKADL